MVWRTLPTVLLLTLALSVFLCSAHKRKTKAKTCDELECDTDAGEECQLFERKKASQGEEARCTLQCSDTQAAECDDECVLVLKKKGTKLTCVTIETSGSGSGLGGGSVVRKESKSKSKSKSEKKSKKGKKGKKGKKSRKGKRSKADFCSTLIASFQNGAFLDSEDSCTAAVSDAFSNLQLNRKAQSRCQTACMQHHDNEDVDVSDKSINCSALLDVQASDVATADSCANTMMGLGLQKQQEKACMEACESI